MLSKISSARGKFPLALVCVLFLFSCGISQEAEDGVLTYAALNKPSKEVLSSIKDFNEKHPDTPIEILDYSDEFGLERLRTELALGRVPDIIEMYRAGKGDDRVSLSKIYEERPEGEYWMPYRQMAEKGYLEDVALYQTGRGGIEIWAKRSAGNAAEGR